MKRYGNMILINLILMWQMVLKRGKSNIYDLLSTSYFEIGIQKLHCYLRKKKAGHCLLFFSWIQPGPSLTVWPFGDWTSRWQISLSSLWTSTGKYFIFSKLPIAFLSIINAVHKLQSRNICASLSTEITNTFNLHFNY